MLKNSNWEDKYDEWKLGNRDDELERRKRVGMGGKYGTIEYEYTVKPIGKCPYCEEQILEDDMWTEDKDGTMFHFQCLNNKIRAKEEEKRDGE